MKPSAGLEPFRGLASDLGDEFEVLVDVYNGESGTFGGRGNWHHGEAIKRLGVLVDKISSPARRR